MTGDPARALASAPAVASRRGLSTARSVLRVLAILAEQPAGVRADEVAQRLGKSTSTAYYLLSSLCEEGFATHGKGVYRPAQGLEDLAAAAAEGAVAHHGLGATVDELFTRTRKRSYLGVVRGGCIRIVAFRGRQGVPRMPGLGSEIRENAHALAMGKVVLADLSREGLERYVDRGLPAYTEHTITGPLQLYAELDAVRAQGFAVDREEFDENFCCVSAPIHDTGGRFVAALGLSMTAGVFDAEREHLAGVVCDIAAAATPGRQTPPALSCIA